MVTTAGGNAYSVLLQTRTQARCAVEVEQVVRFRTAKPGYAMRNL